MRITLNCAFCTKSFTKSRGEFNRSERLGRKHYCSMRCYGLDVGMTHIPEITKHHPENLVKGGWQRDKFSPFRAILRVAKMHDKKKNRNREFTITLDDLYNQWDLQRGICPLTGWEMKIPATTMEALDKTPDRASLDRIDSSIGYTPNNIRFVALIVQYAINNWTDDDVRRFCIAVVGNKQTLLEAA